MGDEESEYNQSVSPISEFKKSQIALSVRNQTRAQQIQTNTKPSAEEERRKTEIEVKREMEMSEIHYRRP